MNNLTGASLEVYERLLNYINRLDVLDDEEKEYLIELVDDVITWILTED
ncbi:MAG: hypothetical protein J6S85_13270 [Methanobrevibacter sp.]|nr:hypothetical protein [Methanobrevibacter sp.]